MKYYYINPTTRDLVIFDSEAEEVAILERIEKVRVLGVAGGVLDADFRDEGDRISSPRNSDDNADLQGNRTVKERKKRKTQTCKKCGKPGHRSDNPEFHPKEPAAA